MEGDDEEEDIDDIEHEFDIDDDKNKEKQLEQQPKPNKQIAEAMLYGKMSYGRGPEDGDGGRTHFPPIITGISSRPVCFTSISCDSSYDFRRIRATRINRFLVRH